MIRHLHSLRRMQRDSGWIHTLLEEAENERMHLMTFMELRKPGPIFKYAVVTTQMIFTFGFSLAYLISPNFCHRYVISRDRNDHFFHEPRSLTIMIANYGKI